MGSVRLPCRFSKTDVEEGVGPVDDSLVAGTHSCVSISASVSGRRAPFDHSKYLSL